MLSIHSSWLQGMLQGLFIGAWAAGSLLIVGLLLKSWSFQAARYRRLQSLNGGIPAAGRLGRKPLSAWAPVKHLREEMEVAELHFGTELLLAFMLVLGFIGGFGSDAALHGLQQRFAVGPDRAAGSHVWMLSIAVALLFASFPYFYVRFRVQHKRQRIAHRMIMLVQNLIGHYRPRLTLAEVIVKSSKTMPPEVASEWRRLELALHMKSTQEALYEFARRVDNEWADDLADLLLIGSHYGTDVTEALHHLTLRMQTAKRHEENRLAMITVYRLGTCFMVAFAFFVVGFNIYADGANYRHYFVDPTGRMLLLVSFIVMFLSMWMVIRSGRRAF